MTYEGQWIAHGRIFVESNSGDASRKSSSRPLEEDIALEHILSANNTRLMGRWD
jgi:hypothetical protein